VQTAPREERGPSSPAAPRAERLKRGLAHHALALPSLGWTLLFFVAPLVLLVLYSFGTRNVLTFEVEFGWTLHNYRDVFHGLYLDAILRSLALSAAATAACLVIGFPVAYTIARAGRRMQLVLLLAVMVPFWTSFVVRTYGVFNVIGDRGPLQQLLKGLGLIGGDIHLLFTPLGVGIGLVYTYLPLMILPLYVALERIDPALLEAANDLGARPWRTLLRVIAPLALPGIIAGCILVGIPATGEYVIPQILGGGKTLMVGNVVADQFLEIGNFPFGAALAMVLTAIVMAVLLIMRSRSDRGEIVAG
jgi:ABC-type spermidine/putrescine transport system permease subunit I